MEMVLGLTFIVAIVGGMFLIRKATGAASTALTRSVRRGAHADGQQLITDVLTFTAPTSPAEALQAISRSVNAHPAAPAVIPGLYERKIDAEARAFIFGSKVQEVFAGVLICKSSGGGTLGHYEIARWSEGDGIVGRRAEMKQVRDRIDKAVRDLGGEIPSVP